MVNFYIESFNTNIDSSLANINTEDDRTITDICAVCIFNISINAISGVFRFSTDAVDLNDVSVQDMLFWVTDISLFDSVINLSTTNLSFDNVEITSEYTSSSDSNKTIGSDYIRYLAFKLFNNKNSVDLFSNEKEVCDSIDITGTNTIKTNINDILSNSGTNQTKKNSNDDSITQFMLERLLKSEPSRIQTLFDSNEDLSDLSIPFEVNDTISFKLTINSDESQGNILGSSSSIEIESRPYLLQIKIVD